MPDHLELRITVRPGPDGSAHVEVTETGGEWSGPVARMQAISAAVDGLCSYAEAQGREYTGEEPEMHS